MALLVVLVTQGYAMICIILTCGYPMLESVKTIESKNDSDTKLWLSFWCVMGIFQTFEMFFGFVLAFIPYYSLLRLVFFVFMMAPQTQGALIVYEKAFKPLLVQHKAKI